MVTYAIRRGEKTCERFECHCDKDGGEGEGVREGGERETRRTDLTCGSRTEADETRTSAEYTGFSHPCNTRQLISELPQLISE